MTTPIRVSPSSLREGRWYEYVIRFALGGAATVFTGLISSAATGLRSAGFSSRCPKSSAPAPP